MTENRDRRVRRTRAALIDALVRLMAERPYDRISVQAILDRADVGRSTFYEHYASKDALLADSLASFRSVVAGEASSDDGDPLSFANRMFRHVQGQRRLLRAFFGEQTEGAAVARLESVLYDVARAELQAIATEREPGVPPDLLATVAVSTFMACLRWWVATDFAAEAAELSGYYQRLTTPVLAAEL